MGTLRLYKKFYRISASGAQTNSELIIPDSISASSFVAGTGDTESSNMVEFGIPVVQESLGVFYANLSPKLYSQDKIYDLIFYVKYTPDSLEKKISTRFRLKAYNIANQL